MIPFSSLLVFFILLAPQPILLFKFQWISSCCLCCFSFRFEMEEEKKNSYKTFHHTLSLRSCQVEKIFVRPMIVKSDFNICVTTFLVTMLSTNFKSTNTQTCNDQFFNPFPPCFLLLFLFKNNNNRYDSLWETSAFSQKLCNVVRWWQSLHWFPAGTKMYSSTHCRTPCAQVLTWYHFCTYCLPWIITVIFPRRKRAGQTEYNFYCAFL